MATMVSPQPKGTKVQETTKLHPIEQFMELFMELDENKDGSVDREELEAFYKQHNLNPKDIENWMKRFDANADGKITRDEFCRGLGLNLEDVLQEQKERSEQRQKDPAEKPHFDGVEIISTSMTLKKQEEVIKKFQELIGDESAPSEEKMNDVVNELQTFLNEAYGRVWQCIVLTGSYWMKFTHEPFMSIQFRYKQNHVVLCWRTHRP
ncbi:uncharacterized protein DEA37_0013892 [Paragonimus westermani]|uniref:EF-hand domain-containing protein n=1 Tax=Paragonimus westermani TaxID=34504 RepID=A0A5J4NAJ9_9TREM|nr:uncharacterized protein DEA37_0013892 [Paragonimus westermani]